MAKLLARVVGERIELENRDELPADGTELHVERRPDVSTRVQWMAFAVFWVVCTLAGVLVRPDMPGLEYYGDQGTKSFIAGFTMFGLAALALTVFAATLPCPLLHKMLWLSWVCIPPTWFMFEYFWWFPKVTSFDRFKYGQQVATSVWAAGVAVTTARIWREK